MSGTVTGTTITKMHMWIRYVYRGLPELHTYIMWIRYVYRGPFLFAHVQEDYPDFDTDKSFMFIVLDEYYVTSLSELCG